MKFQKNLKMFKYCFYKEQPNGPNISIDWGTFEDHWWDRFTFDKPKYSDKKMEELKQRNVNRCRWAFIHFTFMQFNCILEFKLSRIGNIVHGRLMIDEPKKLKQKRRKNASKHEKN